MIRRSAAPRSNHHPSQSYFTDQSLPLQGGAGGHRAEHHCQHDQEVEQDAGVHLDNLRDARRRIDQRRFGHHEDEVRRRQEYEHEYDNPDSALELIITGNTADITPDNPKGPPAFTRALRTLQWPRGFKITGVKPYEGRMNPTQWL